LAGCADFKTDMLNSDMFDPRLKVKVLKVVDVSYGGENGFNQAVELSQECLANVKFVQEKKVMSQFFEEIATDSGKICYGVHDTMKSLEMGALKVLLLYENLDCYKLTLKNKVDETITTIYLNSDQLTDPKYYKSPTNQELEPVENITLSEWLAENYKEHGCSLQFITDKSSEGFQFCKGFGGIGGFLQYKVELDGIQDSHFDGDDDNDFI